MKQKMHLLISAAIILGSGGNAFADDATAGSFQVLHTFDGSAGGSSAIGGVIRTRDGSLYGNTFYGGTYGSGTAFRLTRDGKFTVLHSFGGTVDDGVNPSATLVQGTDGNFYGSTVWGGSYGSGTVFQVTPSGTEKVLHQFGQSGDGALAVTPLVEGDDGYFYGGTLWSGDGIGYGNLFKVNAAGDESIIYECPPPDGKSPANMIAGLLKASDGTFYGVSDGGGAQGYGTLFSLSSSGVVNVMSSFDGVNGADATARLILGKDGYFYGTTRELFTGTGTVFRASPSGQITLLYTFAGGADGETPYDAGLVQARDGSLYGVTTFGANPACFTEVGTIVGNGCGTIFRISPKGKFETIYSFTGGADGGAPASALTIDDKGYLYGATAVGGSGYGTVFSFKPPAIRD